MNFFVDFLKSRWGLGALAVCLVLLAGFAFSSCRSNRQPRGLPLLTNTNALTRVTRDVGSIPAPRITRSPTTNAPRRSTILSLDGPLASETNWVPRVFAPAGSQLRCVLINTIESIRIDTPVIGLVVEDLWFGGQLIVPAGTKLLGKAQVDRVRDRLAANGHWTLVFRTGEELIVQGQALHREESPDSQHWGPDDGSAGFKGQVLKNASLDEIKLFAATFLSGMSQGLQQTESSIFGSRARNSVKNAALNGAGAVLDEYARSIAESIKRDGVYLRVSGGADFYLFIPHTLDRSAAHVGATRRQTSNP